MKYLICEGTPDGEYNASSKARKDVEEILTEEGFNKFFINTKYGVQKKKWKKPLQYVTYLKNSFIWKKRIEHIKDGDIVVFQYPIINTTIGLDKILKKHKDRINIIGLIHDMDSLRYTKENASEKLLKRINTEDTNVLNSCTNIICHNDNMKKELVKLGNNENKVFTLKLFDYIIKDKIRQKQHKISDPIIIAGNLSKEKARYLSELKEIKDVKFNLYGIGYDEKETNDNIKYNGAFKPEELLNHLEGSFGLVWDGNSKDECIGGFGNYLKFNNPHKASMYIAAGIPIITWEKAAIAEFVKDNKVGITVNNLDEIAEKISKISEKQYEELIDNTKKMSTYIRNGSFLKRIIEEVLNNKKG